MIFRREFDRPRLTAALRAWLRQHGYGLLSSSGALLRQPAATLLTVTLLGLALALPLTLHTLLTNLERLGSGWQGLEAITIFMKDGTGSAAAGRLQKELSSWSEIAKIRLITPEEALTEFRRAAGFDAALDALPANPLPYVLVAEPAVPAASIEALVRRLETLPAVDFAAADTAWLRRLDRLLALAGRLLQLIAVAFGLGLLLVVAHTVRVEVQSRAAEIEVLSLAGATPGFIRRPFLYTGLIYGVLGAVIAWLLLLAALGWLQAGVGALALSYGSHWQLTTPGTVPILLLMASAGLLGWLGSWLAVGRHLHRMQ